MEELKFIGAEDGFITVTTESGTQYQLPVTEELRTAVRTPINQVKHEQDLPRPREIQTQLRSGATVEQVAAQYKVESDYVARFAAPVIAELEHTIDMAKGVTLDRPVAEDEEPTTFGSMVIEKLAAAEGTNVSWSSWKDQDSHWIIQVEYLLGAVSHDARWQFEVRRSQLTPTNNDAEQLLGEEPLIPASGRPLRPVADLFAVTTEPQHATHPAENATENTTENDDSSKVAHAPVENVPNAPTLAPVTTLRTTPASPEAIPADNTFDATEALLSELDKRRGEREPAPDLDSVESEDNAIYDRDPSGPLSISQVRSRIQAAEQSENSTAELEFEQSSDGQSASTSSATAAQGDSETSSGTAPSSAKHNDAKESDAAAEDTDQPGLFPKLQAKDGSDATQPKTAPSHHRKRRAMPSWDEIVFGAGHESDHKDQ